MCDVCEVWCVSRVSFKGGGGIHLHLPESPPPLEIRLALFLLKR